MMVFWCGIVLLTVTALSFTLVPLWQERKLVLVILLIFPIFALSFYYYGGSSRLLQEKFMEQEKTTQMAKLRAQLGTPQQVIATLKQHLQQNPQSAKGWYLLGRLYLSLRQLNEAQTAFAQAYKIEPNNPTILFQYASAIYLARHTLKGEAGQLLNRLLQLEPNSPMAINLLGIDAYTQGKYQDAIDYWQRLLPVVSPDSPDGKALLAAIAKAQANMRGVD